MTDASFDVIVVGAGSAGAALATRLSEDAHHRVLLIEAGHDYANIDDLPDEIRQGHATGTDLTIDPDGIHNWAFTAKATPLQTDMPVPRGKITGAPARSTGRCICGLSRKISNSGYLKATTSGHMRMYSRI